MSGEQEVRCAFLNRASYAIIVYSWPCHGWRSNINELIMLNRFDGLKTSSRRRQ